MDELPHGFLAILKIFDDFVFDDFRPLNGRLDLWQHFLHFCVPFNHIPGK